ncbi:MAG: hypothetical protein AB7F86_04235 [Bdellovibrionales bacterium]
MRLLIIPALFVGVATGCSQSEFKANKAGVIGSTTVFNSTEAVGVETGESYLPPSVSNGGEVTQEPKDFFTGADIQQGELPLIRLCSTGMVQGGLSPVTQTPSLKLTVRNSLGAIVCESSDTATLKNMIDGGKLIFSMLCPGKNVNGRPAELTNAEGQSVIFHNQVLYADNPEFESGLLFPIDDPVYEKCDTKSSPLFVDLRTSGQSFELTSPEDGILFDIQGENAKPVPHTKKHIGWFKQSSMAMLVLPNSQAEVAGINELFGNNTRGPDGEFATDGFAALAKYDDNADATINSSDLVYNHLSLWIDRDLNGVAGPGELMSLAFLGIASIDLNYDPNFSETDRYGNEVKYKSVVTFSSGKMKLIYDLWFLTRN